MSAERDLADAIYLELTAPGRAAEALEILRASHAIAADEHDQMGYVLARIAAAAIDAVLARRQREADLLLAREWLADQAPP